MISAFLSWVMAIAAAPAAVPGAAWMAPTPAISEARAHELALSTLLPFARRLPRMAFDRGRALLNAAYFYEFQVTAETGKDRSPNLGFFAVNRATGDVWDTSACIRRQSPEIERLQRRLRQSDALSDREFRRLSAIAPCES